DRDRWLSARPCMAPLTWCDLFLAQELPKLAASAQKEWLSSSRLRSSPNSAASIRETSDGAARRSARRAKRSRAASRAPYTANRVFEVMGRIIGCASSRIADYLDLLKPGVLHGSAPRRTMGDI